MSAVDLGSLVIKSAIERANLKPEQVDEGVGECSGCRSWSKRGSRQMSVNAGFSSFHY